MISENKESRPDFQEPVDTEQKEQQPRGKVPLKPSTGSPPNFPKKTVQRKEPADRRREAEIMAALTPREPLPFAAVPIETKTKLTAKARVSHQKAEYTRLTDYLAQKLLDTPEADDVTLATLAKAGLQAAEQVSGKKFNIEKNDDDDDDDDKHFNGHWAGFELGVNGFYDENYGMYPDPDKDFMELNQPKSLEVNINFMEYNIVLQEERVGLVTGMGWSMNNYKFDKNLTIDKNEAGLIVPVPLTEEVEKTKLTVSYLTVPLMLEFQIPVNKSSNHIFIAGGVVGGVNLGSHTKVKQDSSKEKDHGSFNINPFKCSAQLRAGLKNIALYASYGLTPLFKDDKGPELYPFSIGISLINF